MKYIISIIALLTLTACSSAPKVAEVNQPQPTVIVIHTQPQYIQAPPTVQYYSVPGKYYHNPAVPRY